MGKQPCSDKTGLKRGPWMINEDSNLVDFILYNGIQCWRLVPKRAGWTALFVKFCKNIDDGDVM